MDARVWSRSVAIEDVARRMALIARDVQAGEDVGEAGDRICAAAVELLGGRAEAGISMAHRGREVVNLGATSEAVRRGDELQVELGEGPCLDAAWPQEQVVSDDLAQEVRWPRWGPMMVEEHGIRSMLGTRLFTSKRRLGASNVNSTQAHAFDEQAQEVAELLAVHAGTAVAAAQRVEGLQFAVDRRTTIGMALGIIMAKYDLGDDQAFSVLRRNSSHETRPLDDVARDVVASRGLPAPEVEPG